MANERYLNTVRSRTGCSAVSSRMISAGQTYHRQDRQRNDEVRAEPVVFLSLVEHDLQAADADRQQSDSPVVDAGFLPPQIGRIEDENLRQDHRDHADRNVDVEDPAPTVVVGEPAAGHRTQHGRDHDAQRPERHRLSALLRRKRLQQDGLRERLQSAAACALNDAARKSGTAGSAPARTETTQP